MSWTARSIPDQSGRTAVVTGANSGVGQVTARELARRGARVVLACRSEQRGAAALDRLRSQVPEARAELRLLDLADLSSVREFAHALPFDRLDLLVNNAGLAAVPYARTADGFEMQFGVNHLGHFALTGLLLERLLAAGGARVVTVAGMAHVLSNIDMSDLAGERRYRPLIAYASSKTANLLFVRELSHRVLSKGLDLTVAAAHPGYARTELQTKGARLAGQPGRERMLRLAGDVAGSSPDQGATPVLYAATAPYVQNDAFFGPRLLGVRGGPGRAWRAPWARNDLAAGQLWKVSERLTGVVYPGL
ncbi:oxidoreductase [Streptomyces sp. Amel2xB2]|uniref:oxidoreductase n=1 Tax=Streptomyces sp. Amel2xB2 TaxID=1305829 RepID=UPI000DBAAE8C|nr:oxidoreductase [Streptomyces sp. Amel2xB2]